MFNARGLVNGDPTIPGSLTPTGVEQARALGIVLAQTPLDLCVTTEFELGVDPLDRDAEGFRWRTRAQIADGRSWLWEEDGVVLFKAEASAWTPAAVQIQQVWVDPEVRGRGYGSRGMRDLCRLLLAVTPVVTLFVRTENAPAIALYESVGMYLVGHYRSLLF